MEQYLWAMERSEREELDILTVDSVACPLYAPDFRAVE
jgi:hypothetical protein